MSTIRIMIVEDESIVAKDLENRLKYIGFDITSIVSTGKDAIEKAREEKPDLIVMDILLKGDIDGIEAYREIRKTNEIPVIYLTASSDNNTVQRAKSSQPYGYILKPFDDRELNTAIDMALYRYKMEQRIRESEEWFATTLKSIGEAVIATDSVGNIKIMNPVAEKLTGWSADESIGKILTDVFCTSENQLSLSCDYTVLEILQDLATGNTSDHNLLISKSGEIIPIEKNAAPIKTEDGKIAGVVLIFRDISKTIKAADEIRKLSYVVEQSPNAIIITNILGEIEYVNQRFCEMTGYSHEEVIGKKEPGLKLADASPGEIEQIWDTVRSGEVWQGVFHSIKKNGDLYWEYAVMSPIIGPEGAISHFVSIKEDITERQKAEDALQKTMLQLADLNQNLDQKIHQEVEKNRAKDRIMIQQSRQAAMGEMIGNIAHQWRQPLNSIGIIIQNIEGAFEFNKLDKEYLQNAVDKSMRILKHMSQTIDDFRNFFKPNKEKEEFSIKEAIEKTISFLEASYKDFSISLELDIENDIKRMGYFNEYCQVLLNIMNNSKDAFLERKTTNPKLKIQLKLSNGKSQVTITDNAGGIPESIIDKIFDPYYTTKEHGTGIGLYMSKMIIEKNMGGKITVRNNDEGAEFTIEV